MTYQYYWSIKQNKKLGHDIYSYYMSHNIKLLIIINLNVD